MERNKNPALFNIYKKNHRKICRWGERVRLMPVQPGMK